VPYKIPLANPLIGEEEARAVYEVVRSGWVREGELVRRFEEEFARYLGVRHAIATSSGTAALHVALATLGVGPGDEVIVPSFTCVPPVAMVLLVGATPVFADIEPETYNLDPGSVERMITDRTKAIIPINYAGHPAELEVLQEIAEDHDLYLLNDAAQALGASYKGRRMADFGQVSIFSFSPNKTITTGEGGMVVTNDDELAERARIIKDYGQKPRFHYVELGHNYHMTEMQAAMGLAQLRKIDRILKLKRRSARLMTELLDELDGIRPPIEKPYCTHAYCLYTVRLTTDKIRRDELMAALAARGIQTRIYFPPVHESPLMARHAHRRDRLTATEEVASSVLSLPISPTLTEEDIFYIREVLESLL